MGILYVVFLLVCGFRYTEMHIPARYRQARSDGWDSYFHVGKWGIQFVAQAMLVVLILYINLFIIDSLLDWVLGWFDVKAPNLVNFLSELHLAGFRIDALIVGAMAFALCETAGRKSRQEMTDEKKRFEQFKELVKGDSLEELIFDSINRQRLVLISLKSRKVYVGLVQHTAIFSGEIDNNISLIPFLSGYRDKNELCYQESHSYIDYYKEHKIEWVAQGEELCLKDFRTVIPIDQIEAVSYFDPSTYANFQKIIDKKNKSDKHDDDQKVLS